MVSVVHGEVGTVLNAGRTSISCSVEDSTTTTSTTASRADNTTEEGSSRESEPHQEPEGHAKEPQCSRQDSKEDQSSTSSPQKSCPSNDSVHESIASSGYVSERSDGSSRSVMPRSTSVSSSFRAALPPTNFRRANVSYASAVARSYTTASRKDQQPNITFVNRNFASRSTSASAASSSSHQKRKLSKQTSVDESWSSIFIGANDDEYFDPSGVSADGANVSAFHKPPTEAAARSVSADVTSEGGGSESRTRLQDSRAQSASCPVDQAAAATRSSFEVGVSSASKPEIAAVPINTSCVQKQLPTSNVPAGSRSAPTIASSELVQPISLNLQDDSDILAPVRELLPERPPGAPTVVRIENHPYAGVAPSRTRHLVRSMAMCGDDDTRLRPPPPPSMKTYASVAAVGLPTRNRNSSSLSRESSFTDYAQDLSEAELQAFIAATLHKNPRDRAMLLELEQLFVDFLNNFGEQSLKLPPASSYNRMIIHRVAVLFGLDHNVDNSGRCVVVSKTSNSKPPPFAFANLIHNNIFTDSRKYYNGIWYYTDGTTPLLPGELQRKTQSYDTGYGCSSGEYDQMHQTYSWVQGNQRSFEKQPHYYPSRADQGPSMRKADSFSGVPAFYRSPSGSSESYDRQLNFAGGHAHSIASSTHLSPRDHIEETAERMNNLSFSDRASQISYHSSSSNPPPPSGVCVGYPAPVVQYQVGEDVTYAPYQQQVYVQSAPVMAAAAPVGMYGAQPTIVMPMQHGAPLQQPAQMMACPQTQDSIGSSSQTSQDLSQMIPVQQTEYVQYPVQQYQPAQIVSCPPPQQYQPVQQAVYPTQYQQVIYAQPQPYDQQLIRQPMMQQPQPPATIVQTIQPVVQQPLQPMQAVMQQQQQQQQPPQPPLQQYTTTVYQTTVQPQQYQTTMVQPPMQQQQQPLQPMVEQTVHIQSSVYQQQPPPQPPQKVHYRAAVPMGPPQMHLQHQQQQQQPQHMTPSGYQPTNYGQWTTGAAQCNDSISEAEEGSDPNDSLDVQPTMVQRPVSIFPPYLGKSIVAPLSVLVHPEPMYHYSQTSPIMSSMQQQQMLQIQCQSRPLLYRTSQGYSQGTQTSVDGGYGSMTQESIRDGEFSAADAQ